MSVREGGEDWVPQWHWVPDPIWLDSVLVTLLPDPREQSGQVSRHPHSHPIAAFHSKLLPPGLIKAFLPLLPLPHFLWRRDNSLLVWDCLCHTKSPHRWWSSPVPRKHLISAHGPVTSAIISWAPPPELLTWRAEVCFQQCWHIPQPEGGQAWASGWGGY